MGGKAEKLLPLKPHWMQILLALSVEEGHGFAIRERVSERTGGKVVLWPAMLYGTIRRMTEAKLLEAMEGADDPDDDARRRYYRLTVFGREVLMAEADRLERLVHAARSARPVGGT